MIFDQKSADKLLDINDFSSLKAVTEIEPKALGKIIRFAYRHLNFQSLPTLDLEIASILSKYNGSVSLDNLTELQASCAVQLGKQKGELSLNGIKCLDEEIAIHLSKHRKNDFFNNLFLNGLLTIDSATADALSSFKGKLFLHGIEQPDPKILNKLLSKSCSLSLNQIKSITHTFCEALVGPRVKGSLDLDGVKQVDPLSVDSLTKVKGGVSLNGLVKINKELAISLAKITNTLSLDGLKSLDGCTAFKLFKSKANLSLNGLSEINSEVCEQLLSHYGSNTPINRSCQVIQLRGLKEISKDFAKQLAENRNFSWRMNRRVTRKLALSTVRKLEQTLPYPFTN